MGAQGSVQQDGKSQEDASASASASAGELSAEVNVIQEGGSVLESKVESDVSVMCVHAVPFIKLDVTIPLQLCVCKHTCRPLLLLLLLLLLLPLHTVTVSLCASVPCCSAQAPCAGIFSLVFAE